MHLSNLVSGQDLLATIAQVPYTFAFGILMYLAMRASGTIIVPILLHATTDPSIFMSTQYPNGSPLGQLGALGNIVITVVGLILFLFIRGHVTRTAPLVS